MTREPNFGVTTLSVRDSDRVVIDLMAVPWLSADHSRPLTVQLRALMCLQLVRPRDTVHCPVVRIFQLSQSNLCTGCVVMQVLNSACSPWSVHFVCINSARQCPRSALAKHELLSHQKGWMLVPCPLSCVALGSRDSRVFSRSRTITLTPTTM